MSPFLITFPVLLPGLSLSIDTNKYKQNKQNDECTNTETKNELTTVSLPYIRGTSETIARILKPFNVRIAHKPTRTLRHLLTNVKDKDDPKERQGTVYRIRCNDCNGTYIGVTGRTLTTRLGEHQTATDKEDLTNNIAQHHRKTGHDINWDSAICLTHSTDKDQRLTLESWFKQPTPYPTGDKHTISTLLIKPIFSVLAHAEKQFFSKLVFEC